MLSENYSRGVTYLNVNFKMIISRKNRGKSDKILANCIKTHTKIIINHDQALSFQRYIDGSTYLYQ